MIGVIIGGLGVLVALAVVIANVLDCESRRSAWDRIAAARRLNAERARRGRATTAPRRSDGGVEGP